MSLFVGIDAGINGAVVAVNEYGDMVGAVALPHKKVVPCYRKDKTRSVIDVKSLKQLFMEWTRVYDGITIVVVEESPSYGMGVTSAYTSGYNNGRLSALCESIGDEFDTVAPKRWQEDLFKDIIEECGWSKEQSIYMARAEHGDLDIFEKPKRTADGFADACHIAEWGRKGWA